MSSPFVGEIRMFPGNFAPRGWAFCNGQLLAIASNTALFSLLGTMYGGDGRVTFGLPDLRGRVPIRFGQGPGLSLYDIGQQGGSGTVTLTTAQMPAHTHTPYADTAGGGEVNPSNGAYWGTVGRGRPAPYGPATNMTAMSNAVVGNTGGGLPHNNLSPYLTLNFIIAMQGVFPPRS